MLKEAGVTQAQVADALGLTQPTVSRKIAGRYPWRMSELVRLAEMLRTTPAVVFDIAAGDDLGGAA